MKNQNFKIVRAKRYLRLWVRDAISETVAPLSDTSARLNYIGFLVVLFLIFPQWTLEEKATWLKALINGLIVILYSIPLFFLANLIFSIFRVKKKEASLGEWFGSRFIYHEPQRVLTVLVDENDNETPIVFPIHDAESGSLVSYVIQTDRADNRAKVEIAWPKGHRALDFGQPMNLPKGSFRLPTERKMSLITNVERNSTVTTVRVFMTGWELGKDEKNG
ncbi:hypothetical protein [Saccharospirillum alexandrii]|uniref:hypothetical protein n=1 Tax=Saccharospirillum alexandrii TaxID=2448477 RepID=UPI003734CE64